MGLPKPLRKIIRGWKANRRLNRLAWADGFASGRPYIWDYSLYGVNRSFFDPLMDRLEGVAPLPPAKNGQTEVVVSLTTFPKRIDDLKYAIYSLFRQNRRPNRIVLVLARDEFPERENALPDWLRRYQAYGLEIIWSENLRSYKKLIPTLEKYPDAVIVTADDDIYYRPAWLDQLVSAYEADKSSGQGVRIYAHRAQRFTLDENDLPQAYRLWKNAGATGTTDSLDATVLNVAIGAGGILYPPGSLHPGIGDRESFQKITPNADDLWFWGMAVRIGTPTCIVHNAMQRLIYIDPASESGQGDKPTLHSINLQGENDRQLSGLLQAFPEIYDAVKSATRDEAPDMTGTRA